MGVVHLVIAGIAPGVRIVDLAHELPAHDVGVAAQTLARAAPWLSGVVLAVVDPGVGTARRAVAVEARDGPGGREVVLVGPDNGLLVPAARAVGGFGRAVEVDDRRWRVEGGRNVSDSRRGPTFDGRDVFAPVAAHLASGVDIAQIGSAIDPAGLVELADRHAAVRADGAVTAHVRWIDRFGNAQLDLPPALIAGWVAPVTVDVGDGHAIPAAVARSYQDIPTGAVGLVVDSDGWVSLACFGSSAAGRLRLAPGDRISIAGQAALPLPCGDEKDT